VTDIAVGAYNDEGSAHAGSGRVYVHYLGQFVPKVAEVFPIISPSANTTPEYTFATDMGGDITYGGSCSSATTVATAGTNTITLDELALGTYSDCSFRVGDSGTHTISTFIIGNDTADGSILDTIKIDEDTANGPDKVPGSLNQLIASDYYGSSIANIGDLDGNGVEDLAVGAYNDEGGNDVRNEGALYIHFMNAPPALKLT